MRTPTMSSLFLACLLFLACGNAPPESCKTLEKTPGATASCVVPETCKEGGKEYGSAEGTKACDEACSAVLDNAVCFPNRAGQ